MLITQILQLIKLLGLRRAAKMKKRHEKALPLIRGYAATTCFWTLLNVGFWDDMMTAETGAGDGRAAPAHESGAGDGPAHNGVELSAYCKQKGFEPHVLASVLSYLDGIRLVDFDERSGAVRLTKKSRELLAEPRGLFELLYAYEPVFIELEPMLRGLKKYGADVQRRTRWVGIGSGRLCRQLPYPVMMDMVRRHGRRRVLDLGCGDGAFLMELARSEPAITGVGIDIDAPVVQLANEQIETQGLAGRLKAVVGDMFDLPGKIAEPQASIAPRGDSPPFSRETEPRSGVGERAAADLADVDCLTACDTFHEYLWAGDDRVIALLAGLKAAFPNALLVVGEFCKQSHESLRRRPTAFLEHHLFHQLTNQRIESADRWLEIFHRAGLNILEEKVFDLVGHGYFVAG